jgi:hypothetical protein
MKFFCVKGFIRYKEKYVPFWMLDKSIRIAHVQWRCSGRSQIANIATKLRV